MRSFNTLADQIRAEVMYFGINPVGQHQWGNGTNLVSDITPTIDEAIAHWGDRINTRARYYTQSGPFREGRASKVYAPRQGAGKQEKLEYGLGYIQGRLDEMKKAKTVAEIEKSSSHIIPKDNAGKPPYTPEQLRGTPYVGTTSEKIAREAGVTQAMQKIAEAVEEIEPEPEVPAAPKPAASPLPVETTKTEISQSIANIAKRRGRPPKVQ